MSDAVKFIRGQHLLRRIGFAAAIAFASTLPIAASAQGQAGAGALPTADQAEIRDFRLNDAFLGQLKAITTDPATSALNGKRIDPAGAHSLNDLAARVDAVPQLKAVINKNGLTSRQYLVGTFALVNAAMVDSMQNNPAMAQYVKKDSVNTANISFYESHKAEISALMSNGPGGSGEGAR
jgi:hypothetical protein